MIQGFRNYVYERSQGFGTVASIVGGAYLAGQYALDRFDGLRAEKVQDQQKREQCVLIR